MFNGVVWRRNPDKAAKESPHKDKVIIRYPYILDSHGQAVVAPKKCAVRLWRYAMGHTRKQLMDIFLSLLAFVPVFPPNAARLLDNTTSEEQITVGEIMEWRENPEQFCKCHRKQLDEHRDQATGHVRTSKAPKLVLPSTKRGSKISAATLIENGRNYRLGWPAQQAKEARTAFRAALVDALKDFISLHPSLTPASMPRFTDRANNGPWDNWKAVMPCLINDKELQRDIVWLWKWFKNGRADKGGNVFVIRCKYEYMSTMLRQLTSSGMMTELNPDDERCSATAACDCM